jgi:DNA-binding response OmpR family regulator
MQRTILVIDDDPDLLDAHQSILERAGYRVLTAPDGGTGLQLALNYLPDLILLDLLMPVRNGFLVLEAVRERSPLSPRVVMLTGNGAEAHRDWAAFLGADEYLEKPITLEQLLTIVRRHCPLPPNGKKPRKSAPL